MSDRSKMRAALIQFDEAWTHLNHELAAEVRGNPYAVPPVQAFMLRTLDYWGPQRMSDLAGYLDVTLGGCTTLVDRALEDGLVERERDAADRRVVWVKLSEKGERVLAEMRGARAEILARHFSAWPAEDVRELLGLLGQISEKILARRRTGDHIPTENVIRR